MKQTMLFILIFILISLRCDTTEPPVKGSMSLTMEDLSCTEAWLKLTTTNLPLPTSVVLKQNDITRTTINLTAADTLLYVDSLLPKQTYTFQVSSIQYQVSSNKENATTLDTTSHNFTWQTFTFGQHSHSVLYDVAIINKNNIWAVGEIYMKDSLGQPDTTPFNAVHWNGTSWEIMRIPTKTFSGTIVSSQIKTIFAFNDNDIWMFSIAGSYSHWNGSDWETEFVNERMGSGNKLWGTSSSNLYLVCTNGGISYYNGSNWTKIESGTTVDLLDIWGSPDGSIVWACGYYDNKPGTYLLRTKSGSFEIAYDGTANEIRVLNDTISGAMVSVFTSNSKKIFVGTTTGVYSALSKTNGKGKRLSFTASYFPGLPFRLRGTGLNDFTIVGEYSFVGHYNGLSWRYFAEIWTDDTRLRSVSQKNNLIVAVGSQYISPIYSSAVIYVGSR